MGKRLTQIATRTGDDGTTGLGDNTRVPKDSLRVQAMGDVDELNSQVGLLLCEELAEGVRELLVEIQHQLFKRITTTSSHGCRSSSCPRATVLRHRRTSAAQWPAAPSAPLWRWALPRSCAPHRANT
ncbi:MAG: putative cob(I)yrinic acid a,c-diamide adenosyltransferase [Ramlibacter sp.]|nr:putative cob(I)yrinic acid a,c-diamide adenosyltransferase [Ramlibacter sp.]